MNPPDLPIHLICADPARTQEFLVELMAAGANFELPVSQSVPDAQKKFARRPPAVVLLDESAVEQPLAEKSSVSPLESAAAELTEYAPVVVIAAPERQADLVFLLASGAIDFVGRAGNFLPVAMGQLERRIRLAGQAEAVSRSISTDLASDFGEILRHEVNNPLTGILGNAELLLVEFRKPNAMASLSASLARLQTIAELAVRLRDTVRRISDSWESRHDHARSA
jgi:signal transduction histidine kinase